MNLILQAIRRAALAGVTTACLIYALIGFTNPVAIHQTIDHGVIVTIYR